MSRFKGCLLGLAIGDALGAPVEFLRLRGIKHRYGPNGITDLDAWQGFEAGAYTDDTQMALATARGCLEAIKEQQRTGRWETMSFIHEHYLKWLATQDDPGQRRAPGTTCLSALRSGRMGTIEGRINTSKGCGGVMRTAPIGLVFPPVVAFRVGAEAAAITHGHPCGFLPAGFVAALVAYIIHGRTVHEALERTIKTLTTFDEYHETLGKIEQAWELSDSQMPPEKAIRAIGEGWVGEEALGVALYCSLRFSEDWRKGVIAAVNHSGDSDSTGAITGAILGAGLGVEAIPNRWIQQVEDSERILALAEELCALATGTGTTIRQ